METYFCYIPGLIANGSSVNKIAEHCSTTPILEKIIGKKAPSQSALSRFFSKDFDWLACSIKRLKKLFCTQQETSVLRLNSVHTPKYIFLK